MVTKGLIHKGIRYLKEYGMRYTAGKVYDYLLRKDAYKAFSRKELFTKEQLAEQRKTTFEKDIRFSIIVPLYNTPLPFLQEMIASVQAQTYANWELCLADGSDLVHREVEDYCKKAKAEDARIHYQKLEKNLGISGNTNACLAMAEGDYIGLFDHDDILHPAALFEVMRVICEDNADFIYSDEAVFEGSIQTLTTLHFKPDFAIDNLRANNYICHFSCFSRELLEKVGGFRSEYDGSQDYDFVLRAAEAAKHISHIPEVLYYWRSHPGSVAGDLSSKEYAIVAGRKAVRDHLIRCGIPAEVESSKIYPVIYRLRYTLKSLPKISILIYSDGDTEALLRCLESIMEKTTYTDYEILVIGRKRPELYENGSRIFVDSGKVRFFQSDLAVSVPAAYNTASKEALGEHLVLLNEQVEILTPDWLQELLMYSQREDVGAVSGKVIYSDKALQGVGYVLANQPCGKGLMVRRLCQGAQSDNGGYMGRLGYAQDLSAIGVDCAMFSKDAWEKAGGMDERLNDAMYDADLCLRLRRLGYLIVWTPYAEAYNYNDEGREQDDAPEAKKQVDNDLLQFRKRWGETFAKGDPYYNPNFRQDKANFSL